jgi:hypothetical protein
MWLVWFRVYSYGRYVELREGGLTFIGIEQSGILM